MKFVGGEAAGWAPVASARRVKSAVPHVRRSHASRNPAHVTLGPREGVRDVRSRGVYLAIEDAIRAGNERFGFRLVEHSVLGNHLHLVVEAEDERALSRGMQGLAIRMARAINKALGRRGPVFADRYHARDLGTPTEVRSALVYVLNNARHHAAERGKSWPARRVDPCSSARWFDGWKIEVECTRLPGPSPVARPRTWLLRVGWRRVGLLDPAEVPGANPRRPRRRRGPRVR